jgi:hypothetical protein
VTAADLYRAEASLRYDRREGLVDLERCFTEGTVPERLDGPLDGRLVATTLGPGLDATFEGISRLYLPWLGKTFDPKTQNGRNRFAGSARAFIRVLWPGYRDLRPSPEDGFSAFAFDTSVGPSATAPDVSVLRIDYARTSPWPVRLVLDELVHVGEGEHLGQALMRWRRGYRRVAWFALRPKS